MLKFSFLLVTSFLSLNSVAQDSILAAETTANKSYYPTVKLPSGDMGSVVQSYRFEEAQSNLNTWITQLKRKRKDTSKLDEQLELCDKFIQGLKGTDKVVVFDSIVVDKDNFLSAYTHLKELGALSPSDDGKVFSYTTELGNKMYTPVNILNDEGNPSSTFKCYYLENGKKVSSVILDGLGVDGEVNYPFLMSDGVTLYFSAISDEGYGNYDLYVTRYNPDGDCFYKADNLGFPYNSYANDYMMVIDEENGVGWFASDRFQPEGKVCVYSFIYESSRHPYDYENDSHSDIVNAASLRTIKSTWTDDNEFDRIQAKQRLMLSNLSKDKKHVSEFEFVINENFVYEKLSDFQSSEAKKLFSEWQVKSKELSQNVDILQKMRDQYATSGNEGKARLTMQILSLEEKVDNLRRQVRQMEKEVRILENR